MNGICWKVTFDDKSSFCFSSVNAIDFFGHMNDLEHAENIVLIERIGYVEITRFMKLKATKSISDAKDKNE